MNCGECPYDDCDEVRMTALPEHTPAFCRVVCEKCHRPFWLKLSRLDPAAWTEADFLAEFIVDEATKSITPRK